MDIHDEGFWTGYGYIGFVEGHKILFVSDKEYHEYVKEIEYESQGFSESAPGA